ncbi:hypothetical protein [Stutzerimonas urumqiensis]|uniref:hypothetical protein n=2 Tax=Stutzerimonas urumqiensis TaxID=638269 RepID=UPI000EB31C77|nr:hypothetical protein [Stutzerimonas urumqiensis]
MKDPLERGAAGLPASIGEGCLSRFDPDALNEESGADFSAAAALLGRLGDAAADAAETEADSNPP